MKCVFSVGYTHGWLWTRAIDTADYGQGLKAARELKGDPFVVILGFREA